MRSQRQKEVADRSAANRRHFFNLRAVPDHTRTESDRSIFEATHILAAQVQNESI